MQTHQLLLRRRELADEVFLQHLAGVLAVSDVLEAFGGIAASRLEHDLFAARVLVQKLGDVIDLPIDRNPARLVVVVLLDLRRMDRGSEEPRRVWEHPMV